MIDSKDISVIVQGPVNKMYTPKCLKSIRRLLPNSEIILSTFYGNIVDGLLYDKVVLSEDPGATLIDVTNNVYNNVNRQLISTKKGIQTATKKYSLKFRTDLLLLSIDWIKYFGIYDHIVPSKLFQNRVIICDFYTRNPRIFPLPFHMSDWIMFGNTFDLIKYYDTPLQNNSENSWFFTNQNSSGFFTEMIGRYFPEQYLCAAFLKRNYSIFFENFYDNTKANVIMTERFFAENTIILDYKKQVGIEFVKYNPNRYFDSPTLIHFKAWKTLYNKYCLKKKSVFWIKYRINCLVCLYCLTRLRKDVIRVLDTFHLKKGLKILLNKH